MGETATEQHRGYGLLLAAYLVAMFVCLAGSAWCASDVMSFRRDTVTTQGVVVRCQPTLVDDGDGGTATVYVPVVSFEAGGRDVTFSGSWRSSYPEYAPGTKVTVRYHPAAPERAQFDSFLEQWVGTTSWALGAGLFAFAIGATLLMRFGARPRGPRALGEGAKRFARAVGLDAQERSAEGMIDGRKARLTQPGPAILELAVAAAHPPRVKIRRPAVAPPSARDERLASLVKRLFAERGLEEIEAAPRAELYADRHVLGDTGFVRVRWSPGAVFDPTGFARQLDELARLLEGTGLKVVSLGERRASRGESGLPRCAWCHADLDGSEPDLVACERCSTVLHDACWQEQGGCPVMGCASKTAERAPVR
jgi:hypothetical protein